MALKKFNPTTPGQRNLVLVDKGDLYKGKPVKKLTQGLTKSGGRNNSGHVTAWHRGGGHKRRYRMIDFKRTKTGMMATVERLARSAGTYIQLVGRDRGYAILRLTSGEVRLVRGECMASIGAVSNPDQQNIKIGKAGRSRWLGKRPHVRGVVMNPIDHPHGGGEGRTSGGRHPVTPWGKPTKGKRTRSNKKTDRLIVRRRKP